MYRTNPKTKGSGIFCCIPQPGICPVGCEDCFFQSGRSYLEPLVENVPNMPNLADAYGRVIRVNDGNDSNNQREFVIASVQRYPWRFYNTSIAKDLGEFDAPVVLTVNPGPRTDHSAVLVDSVPPNLMFIRVRTNTWNLDVVDKAVEHYAAHKVPIVLTFMAYYGNTVRSGHEQNYIFRKRTLNSYNAITTAAWEEIMARYRHNKWVYSCGKIEGEKGTSACRHCGNCLREYFATMERLKTA